jgi:hypothetical protein
LVITQRKTTMGLKDCELGTKRWSVIISVQEHDKATEAKAHSYWPGLDLTGVGQAPHQPTDDTSVEIGDERAAARALSDLAAQLFAAKASHQ